MKRLIPILTTLIMTTTLATAQDGKAHTTKTTFSRETSVSNLIKSDPAIIWALLTNASDYPRWNSTVTSLEGSIVLGGKIKLKSVLDAKRTFVLKVKTFEINKKLVWGDGQGNRIFTLTPETTGITFSMSEKIGGLMFPMYANMIPSFDDSFEKFAADLKKEAEIIHLPK